MPAAQEAVTEQEHAPADLPSASLRCEDGAGVRVGLVHEGEKEEAEQGEEDQGKHDRQNDDEEP